MNLDIRQLQEEESGIRMISLRTNSNDPRLPINLLYHHTEYIFHWKRVNKIIIR